MAKATSKQAEILAAAVREFQAEGFDRVSMDRIAESAGASKRTVYNYFPSKDDLFQAMVDALAARCKQLDFEFHPDQPIDPQLLAVGRKYVDFVTDPDLIGFFRVVTARILQRQDLARAMAKEREQMVKPMTDWMNEAIKAGLLSAKSASVVASQFMALIDESLFWPSVLWHQTPPSKRKQTEVIRAAMDLILAAYRGDSPTRPQQRKK